MMGETDFWNDSKRAQKLIAELKVIRAMIDPIEELEMGCADAAVGLELAREAGDQELLEESDASLFVLTNKMQRLELQSLLSEKHDHRHCYFAIQAGVGGTEANDWAAMLERMYLYYWESMGFKIEELSRTFGTETGISEVSYAIRGPFAYGYSSCECGSHRLARVSPFNAEGKRQTSFATVDVTPEFEDSEIVIPEKDLEITPFVRASGPGGQNVNKVASAIRVVHLPTGIQVVANTFRDQSQNRKQALAVMLSKLEQIEQQKRDNEIAEAKGGKVERGWGTQIRSYVFYDNRVKDHRTNYEEPNPQNVLNGHLHAFVDAELKRRRRERDELTIGPT
ncbi:MAG: PCRF domain-containing protein [Phycisphaerales bacterium]|nr:PCRF domain-containing protein [Phycisphaerales bacterium]